MLVMVVGCNGKEETPIVEPTPEPEIVKEIEVEEPVIEEIEHEPEIEPEVEDEEELEEEETEEPEEEIQGSPQATIEGDGWTQVTEMNPHDTDITSYLFVRIVSFTDDMSIIQPLIDDYTGLWDLSAGPGEGLKFAVLTYEVAWDVDTPLVRDHAPSANIRLTDIENPRRGGLNWNGVALIGGANLDLINVENVPAGEVVQRTVLMSMFESMPIERVGFRLAQRGGSEIMVDIDNNFIINLCHLKLYKIVQNDI